MQWFIANISSRVISVRASSATNFSYIPENERPTPDPIYILRFFLHPGDFQKKERNKKGRAKIEMKVLKLDFRGSRFVFLLFFFFINIAK